MRMSLEKGVGLRREDSPGMWVALLSEMGPGLNGRENRTLAGAPASTAAF